ncbi:MAG: replicative DNA helicase [Phycisphaerae bacterium]|nr:replicative DNA helicase [Phycisphaerae bacterium]
MNQSSPLNNNSAGSQISGRVPPQDLEAEICVLGSMMLDRDVASEILQILRADNFYRQDHQLIYAGLLALYEDNKPIDVVLLRQQLQKAGKLEQAGGPGYLVEILEAVPTAANGVYYAKIVRDKSMLRSLISATNEINVQAYETMGDVGELMEEAERKVFEVTQRKVSGVAKDMHGIMAEVFTALENRSGDLITGLPTGFTELDEMTCGLQPGELIIIAARPSMGKTAFALNIAEHVAADHVDAEVQNPLLFFSLEMSAQLLAERILAGRSNIDSQKLRRGLLNADDYSKLQDTAYDLSRAPIFVDDSSTLTPLEMRAKCRRMKMQHGIKLILVDYMQLMHAPGVESRVQEVGLISRNLKALARELDVPVIAMAQLNRGSEGREGHRPRMSDLRESGNIEQDADVIMLLHREGYYKKHAKDDLDAQAGGGPEVDDNIAEIIIEKQRNGPTGVVKLTWIPHWTRFENLSKAPEFGV